MLHLRVTPEIEMRQIEPRDADALYAVTDSNRAYLREWLPWVDHTHSPEDTRTFIAQAQSQYLADRGPNTAIWKDGAIAGAVGCHPIDWANRSCSIGYWIDAVHQGQGIITRCCVTFIDYLFETMKLHRVVIQCGTGNTKSCAVPQRLGFTREGVLYEAEWVNDRWVDLVSWSMLEQNWQK
jgi:ribosomal-protein-serine acetyltransferase